MGFGYKGKYTKLRKNQPRGLGVCDYSGFLVRHKDLIRQYEYRGNGVSWTGFWVHPKFADKPNPQNLTPIIRLDPIPLDHARPDPIVYDVSVSTLTLDVSGNSNITLTQEQSDNSILNFVGTLTGNIIIYVPATYNEWYANNLTTGDYTLSMQIIEHVTPNLLIPHANPLTNTGPLVFSDGLQLSIIAYQGGNP